ncbi:MAG: bifunctional nuclease family protein [Nitrospira sp.]|nr:bifunctional nuclease family protein [Nitrospira sp.]
MALCKVVTLVALLWLVPVCSVVQGEEPFRSHSDLVKIAEVTVRMSDHGPVVLLRAEGRTIPIFVDLTVALSIQSALSGEKLPRPMTHDLMHTILNAYGGTVTQTVITLKGGTYYGALTVRFKDQVKVFDSRSSDSIALAVYFKAPILVGRDLLESIGETPEKEKGAEL